MFNIIIKLCPLSYINSQSSADLVPGKCPSIISEGLIDIDSDDKCNKMIYVESSQLYTYTFLPSSADYKRVSVFSLNFCETEGGVADFEGSISCSSPFAKKDLGIDIIKNNHLIGHEFELKDGRVYPGWLFETASRTYRDWLTLPDYYYTLKYQHGQYFLLWGCAQVNVSTYDRGLWLMGPIRV